MIAFCKKKKKGEGKKSSKSMTKKNREEKKKKRGGKYDHWKILSIIIADAAIYEWQFGGREGGKSNPPVLKIKCRGGKKKKKLPHISR